MITETIRSITVVLPEHGGTVLAARSMLELYPPEPLWRMR